MAPAIHGGQAETKERERGGTDVEHCPFSNAFICFGSHVNGVRVLVKSFLVHPMVGAYFFVCLFSCGVWYTFVHEQVHSNRR